MSEPWLLRAMTLPRPGPRSSRGSADWTRYNSASTFVWNVFWKCFWFAASSGRNPPVAALLTTMSSWPISRVMYSSIERHVVLFADVGLDDVDAPTQRQDLLGRLQGRGARGDVIDNHVGAGLGQSNCTSAAQPARTARHQGHTSR